MWTLTDFYFLQEKSQEHKFSLQYLGHSQNNCCPVLATVGISSVPHAYRVSLGMVSARCSLGKAELIRDLVVLFLQQLGQFQPKPT